MDDQLINILLVGQDRYAGTARQRSDTMLLCGINPETKKVSMIAFLRDLYVQIPGGYSDNHLNAAYTSLAAFLCWLMRFCTNFGIAIDDCSGADLAGFRNIIDILDGVDITLTAREAEVVGVGSDERERYTSLCAESQIGWGLRQNATLAEWLPSRSATIIF